MEDRETDELLEEAWGKYARLHPQDQAELLNDALEAIVRAAPGQVRKLTLERIAAALTVEGAMAVVTMADWIRRTRRQVPSEDSGRKWWIRGGAHGQ